MKSHSLVSILVPIFNVEKYLDECLDSLVNQTLKDIEIICINDGSTDNSLKIIRSYMKDDSRIKLIDKSNTGYGDSMNQGLKFASSKYIGIVESDDIADLKMFEELYALAKENSFPDIIKSNYYEYWGNSQGKRIKYNLPNNLLNKVFTPNINQDIFKSLPSIWSSIYKREFLNQNNIYFNPTPGASYQDTGFYFKTLALSSTMFCSEKAHLIYRRDNEASSVNNKEKIFCICDEFNSIEYFLEKYNLKNTLKKVECSIKFSTYIRNYQRISKEFKKEFLLYIKKEFDKEFTNKYLENDYFNPSELKLLKSLLISTNKFEEELKRQHSIYLKNYIEKIKKQLFKIDSNQEIILYGFNDLAKELYSKLQLKYSNIRIIDKNKSGTKYKNITIASIENIILDKDKIIIICTINEIFTNEIKNSLSILNKDIKIISL